MNSDISQIGSWIAISIFVILWIWFVQSQSPDLKSVEDAARRKKEAEDIANSKQEQADLELISDAQALLPDYRGFIYKLRHRFHRFEIAEAGAIYGQELNVLEALPPWGSANIELPNLTATRHTDVEKQYLGTLRRENSTNAHFAEDIQLYGIDSLTEQPTTKTLHSLERSEFVTVESPDYQNGRDFRVSLKGAGENALELLKYCDDHFDERFTVVRSLASPEVRAKLKQAIETALFQYGVFAEPEDS